jgi:hypothetical protein
MMILPLHEMRKPVTTALRNRVLRVAFEFHNPSLLNTCEYSTFVVATRRRPATDLLDFMSFLVDIFGFHFSILFRRMNLLSSGHHPAINKVDMDGEVGRSLRSEQ